ncbi:hypothetical protein C8R46DRAFT_997994 [Mycena filopes]|nr:hypothetical protein C8R46DRAFT_997994 [Mycena filopes]
MDVDLQTAATSPEDTIALTRADGLWFEDCGLIIQAETTIFRVSRDFLAFHSPVFKDMLSLPPPTSEDMMDGCPFVVILDTAEDVTVFLILTGVLRMSHKYEVDALRKRGLTHISTFYPTTLSEYLALRGKTTTWMDQLEDEHEVGDQKSIVILARQLSIEWILPVAFYRICVVTTDEGILDDSISKADQITMLTACRFLEGPAVSTLLAFLWPNPDVPCFSPMDCGDSRVSCRREVEERRERAPLARSPVPFEIWSADDWEQLEVCNVCLTSMKLAHREAMQNLWDSLPELLGLPACTELQKMKDDALR